MREIKFRAWDPERNNWTDNEEYGSDEWYADYVHMSLHSIEDFQDEKRYAKFILEQYTGLKDKNGKEIYENDIVEAKGYFYPGVVKYDNVYAQFIVSDINFLYAESTYSDLEWEVIGNIHENPELQGVNENE